MTTENLGPAGGVYARVTRDYLAPAPSLDRIETAWQGADIAAAARMDFDGAGQLVAQWAVDGDDETLVLTQAWNPRGQVIDRVAAWPSGPLWGDVVGETHTTFTYGGDRLQTERSEDDTHADGTIEHVEVTEWSWSCE